MSAAPNSPHVTNDRSDMPSTVAPVRRRRHPRTPARWASEASKRLPYTPMTIEKRVHGPFPIQEEVAELIRQARAWGDSVVQGKIESPIRCALADGPLVALPEAFRRAQLADSQEEMAETRYLTDPSLEARHALVEAIHAQVSTSCDLLRALEDAR